MNFENVDCIKREAKVWLGIDLIGDLQRVSESDNFNQNLKKIVEYYNGNNEESFAKLRNCIQEIKLRLLEQKYNCKLTKKGFNSIKIIKDYNLYELSESLSFSMNLRRELAESGINNLQDLCLSVGEKSNEIIRSYDSLDSLELTVRSHNALKRYGIKSIEELTNMSVEELKNIRNLGVKCQEEIISKLYKNGYILSESSNNDNNNIEVKRIKLSEHSILELKERFKAIGIELKG